jgi:ribosomal protein S18 acetylase RimI-like enzyme
MIRAATATDVPAIARLIRELADYERALHEVQATEDDLRRNLFGPDPKVFAHVAVDTSVDTSAGDHGEVVGFALWFLTYSTWLGTHGIYLEDLYVRPEARGGGHGKALLAELARIAAERGYGRVEWAVLNWNEPAIGFYKSLGALPQDEWTVYRLTGTALRALAGQS